MWNPLTWLSPSPCAPPPLAMPVAGGVSVDHDDEGIAFLKRLIRDIGYADLRENALLELSKQRELIPYIAPLVWNGLGTVAALLQEIVPVYRILSPSTLSLAASRRVCNAILLFQYLARHEETKIPFLIAQLPVYVYPFLFSREEETPFQHLRIASLGVICALLKGAGTQVIHFLLDTEIVPLLLSAMESGNGNSKTVAAHILQTILSYEIGLCYIYSKDDRLLSVCNVLNLAVEFLVKQPSPMLLKNLVFCYLRLSESERACLFLHRLLPNTITDGTFNDWFFQDLHTRERRDQLISNVIRGYNAALSVQSQMNPYFVPH